MYGRQTPPQDASYSAKDITVLEGLEPVRLRPGMYIGSTGLRGLHHLVYEVVDNAVDEAMAGFNDSVEVTIHPDNSVTVVDRGRGIPVDVMADSGLPALTVVLTKLHAGGKFGGDGYKVSGGLHGVGVSVVNALSEWLVATVELDGKVYRQEFARGVPQGDMKPIGMSNETGTTISFLPDSEIFEEIEFSAQTLVQRLRETAFLTRGLRDLDQRRARRRRGASSSATRAGSRTSSPTSTSRRTRSTATSPTSRTRPRPATPRSRCSGTPPTRSRSSRSPTTSTRSRAARTCRASARR